ncbi:hypothetical protein HNR33_003592 [Brassicibacter mesophilus]
MVKLKKKEWIMDISIIIKLIHMNKNKDISNHK